MNTTEEVKVKHSNEEDDVNLKNIYLKLANKWHWFLIGAVLGLIAAILYVNYTAPIYKVNAKVLINSEQKGGGVAQQAGALMDLGNIIGAQSSVDNEAEVLKTPDLLEEVVRMLTLNITYGYKSNLVSRELYHAPFKLLLLNPVDTIVTTRLNVTRIAGNKIRVQAEDFDKELSWNQSFVLKEVGTVQLMVDPAYKMTDGNYFVTVSSVDNCVAALMGQLAVTVANKQATIVDISLNYAVQKKGEEVLAALISKYKASNIQDKNAIADSTYTFIKQRLTSIASELGDVENKVERFKQENNLADMTEQGRVLVQSTEVLTTELAKAETQVSVLNDLENYLQDETKNKRVFPTALLPQDIVFSNLMSQYNALLADRDRLLLSVTDETPFVKNVDVQIAGLRKGILSNIQSTKNTYVVTRDKLRAQLNTAQSQIGGVPQIEKNYLKLARNQQIKQELYIFLMQKAEETMITKTSNISIAKVIARPKATVNPINLKKNLMYVLGIFGGLAVPLGLVIVKSLLNSTITTRESILGATKVPIIGEISHNLDKDNLVVSNHGRSAISEQFRALRTSLGFYLKSKDQKVIMVTSSMSGEGKSFTAINLANVLAISGKKVVLLEMDLRKPGLSSKLDVINDYGFTNYIINENVNVDDIVKPLKVNQNMFIVSSGPIPPNPAEILLSEKTAVLIEALKAKFDYLILDAPPIGIITDAQLLSVYADMSLYIVRQKITKIDQLSIVDDIYRNQKINNIAILVNDVDTKAYGYGAGYGYYLDSDSKGFLAKWKQKLTNNRGQGND